MKRLNNETIENILPLAEEDIETTKTLQQLERVRIAYLGRKGKINKLFRQMLKLKPQDRRVPGKRINEIRRAINSKIGIKEAFLKAERELKSQEEWTDLTRPAKLRQGSLHLVTRAIQEIAAIFSKIGFIRASYPEVDWDWYVFESLNMPPNHPARDEWETFFVDAKAHPKLGKLVLTPHTSNGQVRELERLGQPPIRMINISRCYRRQEDVTHTFMFHQFEGLVVDQGINLTHLKGTMEYFAQEFYGPDTQARLRPFHFQFTEPSLEVDFSCVHCNGKGCRFCKSGWHEVGGAGMVHPKVLENGGFDPNKVTGFAFGWGIERTLSLRPDVQIDDIRLLYENDIRFLRQF